MATVLTINGGSSSIRFALYDARDVAKKLLGGKIDRIGLSGCTMPVDEMHRGASSRTEAAVDAADHRSAAVSLLDHLGSQPWFAAVRAVGHRIVHGMQHSSPERATPALLAELRTIIPYDPE